MPPCRAGAGVKRRRFEADGVQLTRIRPELEVQAVGDVREPHLGTLEPLPHCGSNPVVDSRDCLQSSAVSLEACLT